MNFTFLHELPYYQQEKYPNNQAFVDCGNKSWNTIDIDSFIQRKEKLSRYLNGFLKKGDRVAIISHFGSSDWFITDTASLAIGAVVVPIFPNYTQEELQYVFDEIEASCVFCQNEETADKIQKYITKTCTVITFEESKKYSHLKQILDSEIAEQNSNIEPQIDQHDLATIIYTSGSTGMPKGVMLSHRNIVSNIKAIITLIPIQYKHVSASFLPLSHIFERMVIYSYMTIGVSIHFIQDSKEILSTVQKIKPHFMSSVPRILERLHKHIELQFKKAGWMERQFIQFAKKSGEQKEIKWFQYPKWMLSKWVADVVVYRRWRKIIGGRMHGIIVGAAALDPKISRLFTRADIPIKVGYGLTETSPVVSFNRFEPGGTKIGSVGIPIPGVEVKIANQENEDVGEILVKGPNVMLGYYKNQKLTEETIIDGWLHTGDIGKIVHNRFLELTDRKSAIYKTSSGKFAYPRRIEQALKQSPAIDQCMIVCFQKPYVGALIVPDFEYLLLWCAENNVHWTSPLYMVLNDAVIAYYQKVIDETNQHLRKHEQIRTFNLISNAWSVDSGEYTPTLKIKRKSVLKKYEKAIKEMYS